MFTRLLAVSIAAATLLLTGCQTTTTQGYLSSDKRDQQPIDCRTDPPTPPSLCYVQVDPSRPQWVSEYIRVNRGGVVHLWLPDGWEYVEPGIKFKTAAGVSALDCSEHALRIVRCKLTDSAQSDVKYEYAINVKGKSPYDPFVWPR